MTRVLLAVSSTHPPRKNDQGTVLCLHRLHRLLQPCDAAMKGPGNTVMVRPALALA